MYVCLLIQRIASQCSFMAIESKRNATPEDSHYRSFPWHESWKKVQWKASLAHNVWITEYVCLHCVFLRHGTCSCLGTFILFCKLIFSAQGATQNIPCILIMGPLTNSGSVLYKNITSGMQSCQLITAHAASAFWCNSRCQSTLRRRLEGNMICAFSGCKDRHCCLHWQLLYVTP